MVGTQVSHHRLVRRLGGGALVVAGAGWFAFRGPRAASIELEPSGPLYLRAGTASAAPVARPLDAQGNVIAGLEVSCTSDTPAVRLRDGTLASDAAGTATIRCSGGGAEATYAVRSLAPYRSATIDYELLPIPPRARSGWAVLPTRRAGSMTRRSTR